MDYSKISQLSKTPRNFSKKDAKDFLKNDGSLGKWLMISFLASIVLAIISIVLYLVSIVHFLLPIIVIVLCVGIYFSLGFSDPKANELNSYPLALGYVVVANYDLYDNTSETQGGAIMIFTKDKTHCLDKDWITEIGIKIKNKEISGLESLYKQIESFHHGGSFFSFDIPSHTTGQTKVYCSYVILDSSFLPNGKIPSDSIIPCLIDDKDRGMAIPSRFYA